MSAQSADMNELKSLLRGLLISTRKAMTADDLQRDFNNQEGRDIPYKKFGFKTLLDLLHSIPDTVKVEASFGFRNPIITPVLSEKSSHVEALVQKQKVNPPKHGYARMSTLRRNAVHPPIERPKILIPHQLQQRLGTMLLKYPEGVPIMRVEQEFHPGILRNYGVNCSVHELLDNLGHIVRVINGKVYLLEGTVSRPNPSPFQINFRSGYRFMPPRIESVLKLNNVERRQDSNLKNETVTNLNHSEKKPAGFEDEENKHDYVQNGDLNLVEISEENENDEIDGRPDDNYNTVTISTEENYSSHNERLCSEDIPTNSTPERGSLLVNNTLRSNFRTLLDKNPNGIQCSKLPQLYKENFKVELDYRELGFFSVLQMVSNLTDIFHCIRQDGEDWKVLDARNPLPQVYQSCDVKMTTKVYKNTQPHVPTKIKNNIERLLMLNSSGLWSDFFLDKYQEMFGHSINFKELNFDSLESFLLFLNGAMLHMRYVKGRIMLYPQIEEREPKTDTPLPPITEPMDLFLELYPSEVVGPRDTIPQQKLPPDISSGSFLEVIIAEVYTPHHFWLQLRGEKTHLALDELMNEIQLFYGQQFDYQMPEVTVRTDQYCMAPYNEEFHRARIIAVPNLIEAQVCFVDYGTKSKVKKTELRFMHQDFAKFPIQAIKASLANIKPANGAAKWPIAVSRRFLQLVSDKNLVAIVSNADHQNRELEIALVDTTGEEDIHINDTLKHEGLAEFETSILTTRASPPATQQRIEIENVAPTSRRPPPGFTSVPASPPPQPSAVAMGTASSTNIQQEVSFSGGVGQPCFVPPASSIPPYINPALNNPIATNIDPLLFNMQLQQAYLCSLIFANPAISALMYGNSFAALSSTFGMPRPNSPEILNPHMNNNVNSGTEANISKVSSSSEAAGQNVPASLSPESHPVLKSSPIAGIDSQVSRFGVANTLETESEKAVGIVRKISSSSMSTESSMLEQFDVLSLNTPLMESENVDSEPDSEDAEAIFRSDDEDTDAIVEDISEKSIEDKIKTLPRPASVKPLYVKKVEIVKKCIHVINVQSMPYICTDEIVRLFTEFSGRHVILKILDAKGVILPFREISRRESLDIFEAIEMHDVVGLQRSFIAGNIMGKIHLTPLLSLPQLLTVLNVRNRELFRGVQEEIDRFNSQDFYWSTVTE